MLHQPGRGLQAQCEAAANRRRKRCSLARCTLVLIGGFFGDDFRKEPTYCAEVPASELCVITHDGT
jgi:hypothetical protein